ncbi:patatin family protein [Tessaracoccus sp. OH4464_COT-324]|uniref:patatin-like phospholipase family protein n=1 Tax=Tessaracoccus sp. OH4464_COT-324 TaxID=2491059 RepID=UPI000F6319BB|nr:patatin-like phospholipase family protein [Tessaracoccus sp. OH4464_COT-324]RRD46424.1 patatin family protein [Tessaracoccus sp. OH4464_COT-324]
MIVNAPDVALVFEGGGMRASFSSGVLSALVEGGVFAGWVGGISAGSSCTANYLVRDLVRTRRSFVEFAADPNFGGFGSWLRGRGLFNAEYIYERTAAPDQPLPYDFEAFTSNPTAFAIGAVRCADGEMVYWQRDDVRGLPDLMKRVRASSTMPLLMPWAEVDGEFYCDGALGPTGGFAHDAARAAGFRRFIVVATRPRGYVKGPQRAPRAMRALLRRFPAVADGLLARSANYNRSREELLALETAGAALLIFPDRMPIDNSERDVTRLAEMFDLGLAQGRRELARVREFAGLQASA